MNIGFTGTSKGANPLQKKTLCRFLDTFIEEIGCEFHHGDCVGADAYAAEVAFKKGFFVVCHPPSNDRKRAFAMSNEILPPLSYMVRNQAIVDAADILVAIPKEKDEILRSGTWATIRRARKKKIPIYIILPNGRLQTNF